MSAVQRNQLLKTKKELSVVKATMGSQIELVHQTALASLDHADLRHLRDEWGAASDSLSGPAADRYREAFRAAAEQLTGRAFPARALSPELVDREIANRSGSKLHTMFPDEGPYRRECTPATRSFSRRAPPSASGSSWPATAPARPRPEPMKSYVT